MSLPKNCNDPAVRAAWIAERQPVIAEYDQLVAAGWGVTAAARRVGRSPEAIRRMRASVERFRDGGPLGAALGTEIDLGLALLACLRRPGETLSTEDIAAWCQCSRSAIWLIEQRALRKLRRALEECLFAPTTRLVNRQRIGALVDILVQRATCVPLTELEKTTTLQPSKK